MKNQKHSLLIYYLNKHREINGAITHTIDTAIALQQQNIAVYIKTSCKPFFEEARRNKLKVSRLRLGSNPDKNFHFPLFLIYALYAVPRIFVNLLYFRIFKGVKTIYAVSKTDKLLFSLLAYLLGMRVLWIEHVLFSTSVNKIYKKLYTSISPNVQIITDSNAVKYQLIEEWKIPNNRIKTIYPGIDAADYSATPSVAAAEIKK